MSEDEKKIDTTPKPEKTEKAEELNVEQLDRVTGGTAGQIFEGKSKNQT